METKPKCFKPLEIVKDTCAGKDMPECKTCKYYLWFKLGDEEVGVNIIKTFLSEESSRS